MALLSLAALLQLCGLLIACRVAALLIYRLWLSPLSKFPGPKRAAASSWYELYYDLIKDGGGLYIWEVQKMHKKYGPIVRVTPTELHVNDPKFFGEIYAPSHRRRDKIPFASNAADSHTFTADHALHRLRREPLQPFFSRRSVAALEPLIAAKINKLCRRLEEAERDGRPVNLSDAFVALTVDVISQYCYADSFDYLDRVDFSPSWRALVVRRMKSMKLVAHFPFVPLILRYLPSKLSAKMFGDVTAGVEHRMRIRKRVEAVMAKNGSSEVDAHRTVFSALLKSDTLPWQEKTLDRLADEGTVLMNAGSETTSKTLGIIAFHLMQQPKVLSRLREELSHLPGGSDRLPSWAELEQIPYLTAIIKEGLRLHHGVSARNPRIATDEDLNYNGWTIPAGTAISSLPALIHLDPNVFPEPRAFIPERWLENGKFRKSMDSIMFSFGRGSRVCLGINLAYAEIYMTIAGLFRQFDMTAYETDLRDVELERDFTIPTPRIGSKGVRAMITRRK